jgi:hypothetical protein
LLSAASLKVPRGSLIGRPAASAVLNAEVE